jgi:hypothetical protein
MYAYIYICVCVCVCMFLCECVCVCVDVFVCDTKLSLTDEVDHYGLEVGVMLGEYLRGRGGGLRGGVLRWRVLGVEG